MNQKEFIHKKYKKKTYPNLQFDPFVLAEDGLDFEVNADSGDEGGGEGIISVSEEEAGLAH